MGGGFRGLALNQLDALLGQGGIGPKAFRDVRFPQGAPSWDSRWQVARAVKVSACRQRPQASGLTHDSFPLGKAEGSRAVGAQECGWGQHPPRDITLPSGEGALAGAGLRHLGSSPQGARHSHHPATTHEAGLCSITFVW